MSKAITLSQIYQSQDPEMKLLDDLLHHHKVKRSSLPAKCELMATASKYIRQSRRKAADDTIDTPDRHSDDNRSVSSNNSKIRGRKKKRYQDMSEIVSEDATNYDMGFYLLENYSEQPNVIMKYLMEKDPNSGYVSRGEKDILKGWIMCLNREDRMEVEKERTWFPNPRNIELRHITNGLNEIYGTGAKRRLRPGEEASLIESIERFLAECTRTPVQISLRESTIFDTILNWAELEDIQKYAFCMKQLQCHFRIMATRWRYSGRLNLGNKNTEKAVNIAQSRGHFLDLNKRQNPLVKYLLKYSTLTKMSEHPETRQKTSKTNQPQPGHYNTAASEILKAL